MTSLRTATSPRSWSPGSGGLFVVRQYLSNGPDTGVRFIPDKNNEERFTCPACGAEVWLEPFDDLDD